MSLDRLAGVAAAAHLLVALDFDGTLAPSLKRAPFDGARPYRLTEGGATAPAGTPQKSPPSSGTRYANCGSCAFGVPGNVMNPADDWLRSRSLFAGSTSANFTCEASASVGARDTVRYAWTTFGVTPSAWKNSIFQTL